jgi:hypothetical protein
MTITMIKERRQLVECPYCNAETDVCLASLRSVKLKKLVRLHRCNDNSYYRCALFLAKRTGLTCRPASSYTENLQPRTTSFPGIPDLPARDLRDS